MLVCSNCFADTEIIGIIAGDGLKRRCELCGGEGFVTDIRANTKLQELFSNLIRIYQPYDKLPENFPTEGRLLLIDELTTNWNIFSSNLNRKQISKLLSELILSSGFDESYLSMPLGIPEAYDETYVEKYSILSGHTWKEFQEEVKYKNRYFSRFFNSEITTMLLGYLIEVIQPEEELFRGRISPNSKGFQPADMGAPPATESTAGRINAAGIECLYLSDSISTCIHEIRASEYDYVSIAKFQAKKPISLINLNLITKISPFLPDYLEPKVIAINRGLFQEIDDEISKVTNKVTSHLEYIPTQWFSDFIKHFVYGESLVSGIKYKSVMSVNGFNIGSFYPSEFDLNDIKVYRIDKLDYIYS